MKPSTSHNALSDELLGNETEIERLEYGFSQKAVLAPLESYIALVPTLVGGYVAIGIPAVAMVYRHRILTERERKISWILN